MHACKYHPTTPSIFHCGHCEEVFCHACVDHSVGGEARCFHCGNFVEYQVTADSVEPFWRRIEKAFRYPLNQNAMMIIVGLSVAATVVSQLPLPGLVLLILSAIIAGATVNYSFMCLTQTSEGNLTAPAIGDAFSGTIGVLWKLFLLVLLAGGGVYAISVYINPILGIIATLVLFVGIPAVLMGFAHTGSVLQSLNPVNFIGVMTSIGMPYFVLLMFLFIMMSSVGIVSSFISDDMAALSTILQSSVSNYYSVVAFHLMGYMLYQYQDKLGFQSGDDEEALKIESNVDVTLAHVNVRLKEGDYDRAVTLLLEGTKTNPNDRTLWLRAFDVLYRLEDKQSLNRFAQPYLTFLASKAILEHLLPDYKKVLQLIPGFKLTDPYLRYHIAKEAHSSGDSRLAVQLLNGIHKQHPQFEKLVASVYVMKCALDDMPNMEAHAVKCQVLLKQLQQKFPDQSLDGSHATSEAVYAVKEPEALEKTDEAPVENEVQNKSTPIEFR
jgi:hypothetical protein